MMTEVNPIIREVLAPLSLFYGDPTTVECRMNKPEQIVTERRGKGKEYHIASELTLAKIEELCHSLANYHGIEFHADSNPKLSCILPDGLHRFECLVGNSVRSGLSLAIRCKHPFIPSWEMLGVNDQLHSYLQEIMLQGRNFLVSGATNTGKTTFLNMMLEFLGEDARVIAMEDTPELNIDRFEDTNGFLAARDQVKGDKPSNMLDWRGLYDHSTRISPEHIIFGEISTANAFAALGCLNSGITGFACTLHAANPIQALDRKFVQNIAWSGQDMPRVSEFLRELIDVVVQIKRDKDGMRRITDIYEPITDQWIMKDKKFTPQKRRRRNA